MGVSRNLSVKGNLGKPRALVRDLGGATRLGRGLGSDATEKQVKIPALDRCDSGRP